MASNAAMRWQKVSNFAKSLAKMQAQLKFSRSLAMGANAPGGANHSRYMAKLRAGAKHGNTIMRILGAKSAVQSSASSAANAMATGLAVTDVENEEDLDNLELWQQGDASLATEEKLRERQALRHDRRVLEALQAFWEAAQRSVHSGDPDSDELHQEGHAIMLRRIYRVMIKQFDAADAEKTIAEDWKSDSKGAPTLSRRRFCDAFFELADTWTAGISGHEYAAFLWMLFGHVTISKPVVDEHGNVTYMTFVWKAEADCSFDEDTYAKSGSKSQAKRAAASKVQAKVRGKKARKEKAERLEAAEKIQKITKGKLKSKQASKKGLAAGDGGADGDKEGRVRSSEAAGRGRLQYWALRKGLPPKLQDEIDKLSEEEWAHLSTLSPAKAAEFVLQCVQRRATMAVAPELGVIKPSRAKSVSTMEEVVEIDEAAPVAVESSVKSVEAEAEVVAAPEADATAPAETGTGSRSRSPMTVLDEPEAPTDWPNVIGRPVTPSSRPTSPRQVTPQRPSTAQSSASSRTSRPTSRGQLHARASRDCSAGRERSPNAFRGAFEYEPGEFGEDAGRDSRSSHESRSLSPSRPQSRPQSRGNAMPANPSEDLHGPFHDSRPRSSSDSSRVYTDAAGLWRASSLADPTDPTRRSRPRSSSFRDFPRPLTPVAADSPRGHSPPPLGLEGEQLALKARKLAAPERTPLDDYWERFPSLAWEAVDFRPAMGNELFNEAMLSALAFGVREFTHTQLARIGIERLHGDEYIQLGSVFFTPAPQKADAEWLERHPSMQVTQPFYKATKDDGARPLTPRVFAIRGAAPSASSPSPSREMEGGDSAGFDDVAAEPRAPTSELQLPPFGATIALTGMRRIQTLPRRVGALADGTAADEKHVVAVQYLEILDQRRGPTALRAASRDVSCYGAIGPGAAVGGTVPGASSSYVHSFGVNQSLSSSAVLYEGAAAGGQPAEVQPRGSWYNAIRSSTSFREGDAYDARAEAELQAALSPADVANGFSTKWMTPTEGRQGRFEVISSHRAGTGGRRSPPPSMPPHLDLRPHLGPAMPLLRPLPIKVAANGASPRSKRSPRQSPGPPLSVPGSPTKTFAPPLPDFMLHEADGTRDGGEPRWYEPRWSRQSETYSADSTLYDGSVAQDGTLFRSGTGPESRPDTRPPSPTSGSFLSAGLWDSAPGSDYARRASCHSVRPSPREHSSTLDFGDLQHTSSSVQATPPPSAQGSRRVPSPRSKLQRLSSSAEGRPRSQPASAPRGASFSGFADSVPGRFASAYSYTAPSTPQHDATRSTRGIDFDPDFGFTPPPAPHATSDVLSNSPTRFGRTFDFGASLEPEASWPVF